MVYVLLEGDCVPLSPQQKFLAVWGMSKEWGGAGWN